MKALVNHHKGCPFCGSRDLVVRESEDIDDSVLHAVWCEVCDAAGPLVAGDEGRAWQAWDLRTDVPRDWLDPASRGTLHPIPEDRYLRDLARACPFCGHRELKGDAATGGPSCVACLNCEASSSAPRGNAFDALAAWNQRPDGDPHLSLRH